MTKFCRSVSVAAVLVTKDNAGDNNAGLFRDKLINKLQTSVMNWLKAQATDFYDEGIGKYVYVPRYEKSLLRNSDYVKEWLIGGAKYCK